MQSALELAPAPSEDLALTSTQMEGVEHFTQKLHGGRRYLNGHAGRPETARKLSQEIVEALPLRRPHLLRQLERVKVHLDAWAGDELFTWEQIADERADLVAAYLAHHRAEEIGDRLRLEPVRRWAREMLDDPDLLFLDSETTGLEGYLVEIAITDREGAPVFHSLVNPQCLIEAGAQEVHGIGADDVKSAPTFGEIEPKLRELLEYKKVVIYNAAFDMGVLRREVARETASQLRAAGVPDQLPPIEAAPDSLLQIAS